VLMPKPSVRWSAGDVAALRAELNSTPAVNKATPTSKQRNRIWELHPSMHCSIVGTCLSMAELRQLLVRLDVPEATTADDHRLHQLGVKLAGNVRSGAKLLQKALDRRHKQAISHLAKAKDEAAVAALWEQARKDGDIPGGYWAVLTHPATTETLVKRV